MKRHLPYPHPGENLAEEFLKPMGITAYKLARTLHVPLTRVTAILAGERTITADTGLRLARAFGVSDSFWLDLQKDYELALAKDELAEEIKGIKPLTGPALA
jgi:addiction module HigA family antidote